MRFRLLRRRLTIAAPRVAVRNALPWPVRWVGAALVLGFCAAISLWAFEFGKEIAGLERNAREELDALRAENQRLRNERDQAQSVVNTAESLRTADAAVHERLVVQLRQLEAENRTLREDLGFFERLLPANGSDSISIRALQAERLEAAAGGPERLRWQVLVMRPTKNAPPFTGRLELTLAGTQAGKPWTLALPEGPLPLQLRESRRLEGTVDLPPGAVVKTVSARVLEGTQVRATQAVRL
jgi:hypothetical protein